MDRTTLSIWPPQKIFQGRMTSAPSHVLLLLALRSLNVFRQVGWAVDCVFLRCFNVFRQVACAVDSVYYKYCTCSINISLQLKFEMITLSKNYSTPQFYTKYPVKTHSTNRWLLLVYSICFFILFRNVRCTEVEYGISQTQFLALLVQKLKNKLYNWRTKFTIYNMSFTYFSMNFNVIGCLL